MAENNKMRDQDQNQRGGQQQGGRDLGKERNREGDRVAQDVGYSA